jgi:hypothetical protein
VTAVGYRESRAPIALREARAVLSEAPLQRPWSISRARGGSSGRSFAAAADGRRVFLKFDVAVEPLRRLAELAVVPPIVHAGEHRGRSFVVQPFIGSRHPRPRWFADHLPEVARLIESYQRDAILRNLLCPTVTQTHEEHVSGVLDDLERRAARSARRRMTDRQLGALIDQLGRTARDLRSAALVPTHGDPNSKNFILADRRYLVDWDDLCISDPLRDVGQLLWWYVRPNRWPELFRLLGEEDGTAVRDRLFWWVAAESLDVALLLAERGHHARADEFFDDCVAAIERRGNPHAGGLQA